MAECDCIHWIDGKCSTLGKLQYTLKVLIPHKKPAKIVLPIISLNLEKRKFENITDQDISEWKQSYPAVDIVQQLREMRSYFISNPQKRRNNYRKTIINWFAREQDKVVYKTGNILLTSPQPPPVSKLPVKKETPPEVRQKIIEDSRKLVRRISSNIKVIK